MEGGRHVQLGAHKPHQLATKQRSKHWVTVGDDRLRHAVQVHDVVEERLGHGLGGVRVRQGDEVAIFAEAVDDGEDYRLVVHPRQGFHEIEADVGPDRGGNWQQ